MAMKQAGKAQRQFMSDIAEWAICNTGLLYGDEYDGANVQLHHVLGRSAKHNKVAIGHWFILPVPFELHDVSSNHPDNVTHCKKSFVNRFGSQSSIFQVMVSCMVEDGYAIPSMDVIDAIMDTRI
jgi:hypothetical protein